MCKTACSILQTAGEEIACMCNVMTQRKIPITIHIFLTDFVY